MARVKLIETLGDEFMLGLADMDKTHLEFIELVNSLGRTRGSGFIDLFGKLVAHTEQHFEAENQWMKESGFPAMEEHLGEHRRVLADLHQFRERTLNGSTVMVQAYVRETLPEWFRLHASTMDAALAKHLTGVPA